MVEQSWQRKTIPQASRGSREHQQGPDRPTSSPIPLRKLGTCVNSTSQPLPPNTEIGSVTIRSGWRRGQDVPIITPLAQPPLLDCKRIHPGGGRIIGGGTSREASRRARKKASRRA